MYACVVDSWIGYVALAVDVRDCVCIMGLAGASKCSRQMFDDLHSEGWFFYSASHVLAAFFPPQLCSLRSNHSSLLFFSFLFFISIYSCSSHYFPPLSILIPPSLPDINLPLLEFHTLKGRSNFLSDSALLVFLRHCCLLIHSIADLCAVSTLKIIFRAFFWCGRYISERKRAPEMLHMVSVEKYKTCIWTQNTTASLSLHYFLHCPQESLNFYCNLDVLTAAHTQLYTQTHSSQFVPD